MPTIRPTGGVLGASVTDIDLSRPMGDGGFRDHPARARALMACCASRTSCWSRRRCATSRCASASIQTSLSGKFQDPEIPEVGILSNIVEDGKPIGLADAGQDWHTDMSYRDTMGFVNVLNAHKVPRRDGVCWGRPSSPTCMRPTTRSTRR